MRQDVVVIGQPPQAARFAGGPQAGLSWRHVATVLLLVLTVPVFVTAGLTAVLLLPVMLVATAAVRLLRLMSRGSRPVAVHRQR
jgi:hypothetical protein